MGISTSTPKWLHKFDENDGSVVFKVENIDGNLYKYSKGFLKITSNEMVLYLGKKASTISWPLNGIRRYGCHEDIFLFECGRKCMTGEGLYVFKCKDAGKLNAVLYGAIVAQNLQDPDNISALTDKSSDVCNSSDEQSSESEINTDVTKSMAIKISAFKSESL
jgi:hypothetical protein